MNEPQVRLTFPAKADYLLLARLALAGLAHTAPLDPETVADLKLAVTEATGNAVRHAYVGAEGPVTVAYALGTDRLEIVVEDQGSGMEQTEIEALAAAGSSEGGMGMAIIRAVVDELDIGTGPDGNGTVVHMTKYLAPRRGVGRSG